VEADLLPQILQEEIKTDLRWLIKSALDTAAESPRSVKDFAM
jgi:hypothetical protein